MTFNLRYDRPDPGKQNWQIRKAAIAELIHHYQPDLIGTQELKPHQLSELKELLPDYQTIGGDRRGDGSDEYCAIFYQQSRINCLETEDFYLSETPTIAGSITPHWDNYAPRMVTWGRFAMDNSARSLTLLNTHFPHLSHKARELSAELIIRYCDRFPLAESYLFLTGDFNALPNSKERKILKHPISSRVHFQDALESLPMKDQKTFH
ncbi:MAG: endonuclease/exonuclease/phosphatase family protein, partial [Cyanobacteria bacterium P01_E01_bin.42]